MKKSQLIYIPETKPNASIRLICFSYAGGNASTYLPWKHHLHPDIELAVIQLPGRGIRMAEDSYQTIGEIVRALFLALQELPEKPFMFYGHSMGARVAYELTIMLHRINYRLPTHVIASGSCSPDTPRKKEYIHNLPDDEFLEKIMELNGTPAEIHKNKEIMQLALPALRADFKIIEIYCSKNQIVLPTQVSVLVGDEDKVELVNLEGWFKLFKSNTGIHWVHGDHFFINKNSQHVVDIVNMLIKKYHS